MRPGWVRFVSAHPLKVGQDSAGVDSVRDDDGAEFDSPKAAVQAATRSAAEIGTGRLGRGDTSDVVIEIRDERGQRVCTVKASMEIDWHVSRPQGPQPWSA